jgi:hypothetical protein
MDAQQLATDMDMDLTDAVDVYLASWIIDEDDEWLIESTNTDEKEQRSDDDDDWHSRSLIEWICDMVQEENDFVLAFLIEQHQLFTDELTTSLQVQRDESTE